MKVFEVLEYMKNSDLATLERDIPHEKFMDFFFSNLNLGLLALCSKFPVLEKQLEIRRFPHMSIYKLSRDYCLSNWESKKEPKYIIDTEEEPFLDDVLTIISGFDSHGREILLNDLNRPITTMFTGVHSINIPETNHWDEKAYFIYRAKHPKVTCIEEDLLIPDYFLDALTYYIASRMYATKTDQESLGLHQQYVQMYEAEVQRITQENYMPNSNTPHNIKPILGGWI